jgi:hypothetical protein
VPDSTTRNVRRVHPTCVAALADSAHPCESNAADATLQFVITSEHRTTKQQRLGLPTDATCSCVNELAVDTWRANSSLVTKCIYHYVINEAKQTNYNCLSSYNLYTAHRPLQHETARARGHQCISVFAVNVHLLLHIPFHQSIIRGYAQSQKSVLRRTKKKKKKKKKKKNKTKQTNQKKRQSTTKKLYINTH